VQLCGGSDQSSHRGGANSRSRWSVCSHAHYSIQRLRAYFDNGRTGLDSEMAQILADHLDAVVGEVFGIAEEIDEEYSASEA
jgi:hypothetical protein